MHLKKILIFIALFSMLLNPFASNASESITVNYFKKDIVVQNSHRYYPLKQILDKLMIKSKLEKTGDSVKIVLTEGNNVYQIILDEKSKLAYTSKGEFSYVVNNQRIGFTANFYKSILKDSSFLWNSQKNSLVIYEKKPKDFLLIGLEGYRTIKEIASKKAISTQTFIPYEKGQATWYGAALHGNLTASGERFDMNALTAAHKTLPFGTKVKVTNLNNKTSIVVRITDRGPFAPGRVIDLSQAAAEKIDMLSSGVVPVQLEILKTA